MKRKLLTICSLSFGGVGGGRGEVLYLRPCKKKLLSVAYVQRETCTLEIILALCATMCVCRKNMTAIFL